MAVNSQFAQALVAAAKRKGLLGAQAPGSPAPEPYAPPPDPVLIAQQGANNVPYDTAVSQLPENLQAASAEFGLGYSVDPNNPLNVTVGGVDPSNPYSRAALLQRSYDNQRRGNSTGMAARGQLYSGALQNAQNEATRGFQQGSAENQRGFQNLIRGYVQNIGGLGAQRDIANAGALGDSLQRGLDAPPPTAVTYAGVPYTPGDASNAFAAPIGAPTAASVMASRSLRGTAYDRPIISKPYKPPKRPKRKP